MKQILGSRLNILCLLVIAFCSPSGGFAQSSEILRLELSRLPQADGSVQYLLDVNKDTFDVVHLPDGSMPAGGFPTGPPIADLTFSSFGQLKSAVVGTWTIDRPAIPVIHPVAESYTFTLGDFPESAVYEAPPVITSPVDSATVPVQFTMNWEWPAGTTPSSGRSTLVFQLGPGNSWGQTGGGGYPQDFLSAPVSASYSATKVAQQMVLRAGGYEPNPLASYLSPVTSQQNPPLHAYTVGSVLRSLSLPVNVNVVPECSGLILFGIGTAYLSLVRRERVAA